MSVNYCAFGLAVLFCRVDRSSAHKKLVAEILAFSAGRQDLIIFEFKVGMAMSLNGNPFKYGANGVSDLIGIKGPDGKFVAIEVKTGSGRLEKTQPGFRAAVERCGGIYILARSVADVAHL